MSAFAKKMVNGVLTAAMATAMLAVASTADAQYVEHWRIEGTPYLAPASGLTRGLDYNPVTDTVLVAHRSGGNNVIRVSADTGAVIAPAMNTTGIGGGLIPLTKLAVVDLGGDAYSIYATAATSNINGGVADSQVLRVYRWHSDGTSGVVTEDTLGAPTRIYFNRAASVPPAGEPATGPAFPDSTGTRRIGDSMKASNSGTTTTLFFGGSGESPTNYIYTLTVDETTGAVTAANILTATGHTGTTSYGAAPDAAGNLYYFSNGTQMARYYTGAGALLDTFDLSVVPQSSVQPRAMSFDGRSFVGFLPGGASPGYSAIRVVEVTSGVATATIYSDAAAATVPGLNGNGAGEVTLDSFRNRFIGLATDNLIVSWSEREDPLLIELANIGAAVNEPSGTVTISWETASEIDNTGFNVYRLEKDANGATSLGGKVNPILIPGAGDGAQSGGSYTIVDTAVLAPGAERGYVLEDIDANGTATRHAAVFARRAATSSNVAEWPQF